MVVETIYVVRHGFRSNWVVNPETGEYTATVLGPTGISADPALASYGVIQAKELGEKLVGMDPPVDIIYSSPFYRCLETLKPVAYQLFGKGGRLEGDRIKVENGIGEFYGLARFDHPSPAPLAELHKHFPDLLDDEYKCLLVPSKNGESALALHDRVAHTLHRIITALDADPKGPKTLLICTHAAVMIAIGRTLTGRMPDDIAEDDFRCFTCSLSKFSRKGKISDGDDQLVEAWIPSKPIPSVDWNGKGVKGGWECILNGDCSFLAGGEERGWKFSDEEAFLNNPNAFNDAANAGQMPKASVDVGDGDESDSNKSSRL